MPSVHALTTRVNLLQLRIAGAYRIAFDLEEASARVAAVGGDPSTLVGMVDNIFLGTNRVAEVLASYGPAINLTSVSTPRAIQAEVESVDLVVLGTFLRQAESAMNVVDMENNIQTVSHSAKAG